MPPIFLSPSKRNVSDDSCCDEDTKSDGTKDDSKDENAADNELLSKQNTPRTSWRQRYLTLSSPNIVVSASVHDTKTASSPPSSSGDESKELTPEEAGRKAHDLATSMSLFSSSSRDIMNPPPESMETMLAHCGVDLSERNVGMSPPMHFATTYRRPEDGIYLEGDSVYSRAGNPTRDMLEKEISRLECFGKPLPPEIKSPTCCAFSSGMMAISSIILSHAAPVHLLLPKDLYPAVMSVTVDVFSRFSVSTQQVDITDLLAVENLIDALPDEIDCILWMESPASPYCSITDIEEVCKIIQNANRNITTVVDSTLAPPMITQPLLLGADLVVHSATKYLAGHSDALVGVVTASPWTQRGRTLAPVLKQTQMAVGGVASVMDSWFALRGLRTVNLRVKRQCETALHLAQFLETHPSVHKVYYPGLKSHKQRALAKKQMNGLYGGVLSIVMTTEVRAMALAGALLTIQRATSLGGTETLIEHRASMEPKGRQSSPPGLLRMSVGLEDPQDLINDLTRALKVVETVAPLAQIKKNWRGVLTGADRDQCLVPDLNE